MRWGAVRRAFGVPQINWLRPASAIAIAAVALSAAGCASQPGARYASAGPMPVASGATITFDSIDGPPPEVFRKLVASLNDEAETRKIPVVARSANATYRVRGYVSAVVDHGKTSFGWVLDIYDADKHRTLRIAGEEPAGTGRHRNAWAAADDPLLRRMASTGMERIAIFLTSDVLPPMGPAVEPAGVTLASVRDESPEGAGIFRLFGAAETTGAAVAPEAESEPAPPPAQPKRGKPVKRPAATTAAALDAER
jgi:hypothetical protein